MDKIEQSGMYFVNGVRELIVSVGGKFDDTKERPVVALMRSLENPDIFWAIPVGNLAHRSEAQIERIQMYLKYPKEDIRSHFYHIGNTDVKSLFFISDVFPITVDYIARKYLTYNSQHYIIKNKQLLLELDNKLRRILSYEQSRIKKDRKFFFRQNIFGAYARLSELLGSQ